jgi:hypothetical protein
MAFGKPHRQKAASRKLHYTQTVLSISVILETLPCVGKGYTEAMGTNVFGRGAVTVIGFIESSVIELFLTSPRGKKPELYMSSYREHRKA